MSYLIKVQSYCMTNVNAPSQESKTEIAVIANGTSIGHTSSCEEASLNDAQPKDVVEWSRKVVIKQRLGKDMEQAALLLGAAGSKSTRLVA
eukprot:911937-Amphidinium_carterae.1